jgi:hypothetical protein
VRDDAFEEQQLGSNSLVAGSNRAGQPVDPFLGDREVGEYQLELDGVDVAIGIDRALDMGDIRRFEAPDDVQDGVDRADVAEELVSQTLPLGRAFHEPRDVEDLDCCRDDLLGRDDRFDQGESFVRDGDHTDVRLDGGEGVVGGFGTGSGESVEERGLAHVGQAHDSSLDGHDRSTPGLGGRSEPEPPAG